MVRGHGDGGAADYYDVLGVPDTATADDIIRAYRRLVREHHPDRNPDGGSKRFQEITDAYDVIGDSDRRRRYDAQRQGGSGPGIRIPVNPGPRGAARRAGRPEDGPARGGAATATPTPPDRPVVRLSFKDAVLGTVTTVELAEHRRCGRCAGTGLEQPDPGGCPDCGGSGSVIRRTGQIPVRHICARCGGRGRSAPRACTDCAAAGTVPGRRPVKVRVPPGVTDGATLRIRRQDGAVDAIVRVDTDPRFGREGDHLTVRVPVTPAEAALGAEVSVPMVDGSDVTVRIPPGTQPGRRLRLTGRGIRRPDRAGDLLVTVDVVVPAALSEAERAAYEALASVSKNPRAVQ
jgi:molecular chaperone DnaJ